MVANFKMYYETSVYMYYGILVSTWVEFRIRFILNCFDISFISFRRNLKNYICIPYGDGVSQENGGKRFHW